jgi:integrase/recombinase XerD
MMTQLRQRMLEELQRRNYSTGTIRLYLQHVTAFAKHFHRPPDQLGAEEIRRYHMEMSQQLRRGCQAIEVFVDAEALNECNRDTSEPTLIPSSR